MVVEKKNCSAEFLDGGQYSRNGVLRYERIFGKTFLSTGGLKTTEDFCRDLKLARDGRVLDIGCGIGGSAFYLARKYKVEVMGIDLSSNMLDIANEHKLGMEDDVKNRVSFRFLDATKAAFPSSSFSMMYSRDAIMHIADKDELYSKVFDWLKPDGRVLVSEYVHGFKHPNHSQEYKDYLVNRGYQLLTPQQYADVLKRAGFVDVEAIDQTDYFVKVLESELKMFEAQKADFLKDFSQKDYDDIVEGWKIKLVRCAEGEQGWALFKARKPSN